VCGCGDWCVSGCGDWLGVESEARASASVSCRRSSSSTTWFLRRHRIPATLYKMYAGSSCARRQTRVRRMYSHTLTLSHAQTGALHTALSCTPTRARSIARRGEARGEARPAHQATEAQNVRRRLRHSRVPSRQHGLCGRWRQREGVRGSGRGRGLRVTCVTPSGGLSWDRSVTAVRAPAEPGKGHFADALCFAGGRGCSSGCGMWRAHGRGLGDPGSGPSQACRVLSGSGGGLGGGPLPKAGPPCLASSSAAVYGNATQVCRCPHRGWGNARSLSSVV
jgi:hypothetical protein